MALRDALVIDKWRRVAPPDKRRRRAAARLLYFIRFAVSPNINLTQIYKTKPYNKNFPYGSGAAPLNRFRPAPLSPARNVFFLPYILFRMCGFFVVTVYLGFMSAEYAFAPWLSRILSERTWFFPISSHSFFQTVML